MLTDAMCFLDAAKHVFDVPSRCGQEDMHDMALSIICTQKVEKTCLSAVSALYEELSADVSTQGRFATSRTPEHGRNPDRQHE